MASATVRTISSSLTSRGQNEDENNEVQDTAADNHGFDEDIDKLTPRNEPTYLIPLFGLFQEINASKCPTPERHRDVEGIDENIDEPTPINIF